MIETVQTPPYTLESNDKTAQVMVYTDNILYWGVVVVKDMVRVSTWLRTNTAPDRVCIYNARALITTTGQVKPVQFTELYVAASTINIFHLAPPAADPLDYDPTEPNRRMQSVSLLTSNFRIDGKLRLASSISLGKYLEITHEKFTAIYDVQLSSLLIPTFRTISLPYLIFRQEQAVFTVP